MRALISKVLTGSMIASAALGNEMAVFHHPCGKREVANPCAPRLSCPDCEHLFTTPARNTSQLGEG
jgi:hypothetical protein